MNKNGNVAVSFAEFGRNLMEDFAHYVDFVTKLTLFVVFWMGDGV